MKRSIHTVSVLCASLLALAASAYAAEGVKEANPTCRTATAILLTGDGSDEEARVQKIRDVLRKSSEWKQVDAVPENRVGDVAIVRFDIKNTYKGGPTVAYTVQCGHGGTCNDVANAFRTENPTISPAPVVQCGDVSVVLSNPSVLR